MLHYILIYIILNYTVVLFLFHIYSIYIYQIKLNYCICYIMLYCIISHILYIYISVCARLLDTDPTYAKTCLATGRQAPPRKVNKVWSNRKVSVCCLFNTLIPKHHIKKQHEVVWEKCPTLPSKKKKMPWRQKNAWRPGLSISRLWPYFSVGSGDPLLGKKK